MDDKTTQFNADSSAVQTHLSIMQDIIQRMAENSRSCKTWCVTIVSAVLVLVARVEKSDSNDILIALAPAFLFLFLDTYYLALERGFRKSFETFVEKLHAADEDISSDLYVVETTGSRLSHFFRSLLSFSIWPFYLMLFLIIGGLFFWLGICA